MRSRPARGAPAARKSRLCLARRRAGFLAVGQSGGCTAVMNGSLAGIIESALSANEVKGVLGLRGGVTGALRDDTLDLSRLSGEELDRLAATPAAALGSCRHRLTDLEAQRVAEYLIQRGVRYFLYIGGNDSAVTCHQVHLAARSMGFDLSTLAVPKTIDNDLAETDHCPGYGSAARFWAFAAADAGKDTESMAGTEPVKVIEVMGRNSGWLAAASALARRGERDAPHLVLPPEAPFSDERFVELVRRALRTVGYAVVVAAQTLRREDGSLVARGREAAAHDGFGHPRPLGTAQSLCDLLAAELNIRCRWDKPGTIQRMSSAHRSERDAHEARMAGAAGVRAVLDGAGDSMVTLGRERVTPHEESGRQAPGAPTSVQGRFGPPSPGAVTQTDGYVCTTGLAPLEEIVGRERTLPEEFFDRERMLPTEAFTAYALPLVGPGLPRHFRLP